jgi:hypothetical protein
MRSSVAFLGTSGSIENPGRFSLEDRLRAAGANTGNLVFQRAAAEIVGDERRFIGLSGIPYTDPTAFRGVDFLVFPAANHLRTGADWTGLTNFIAKSPAPCVVLGLGAQASLDEGEEAATARLLADENLRRFADALARKCVFISVRGRFSRKVAEAFGLDVEPLGCPSLFLSDDPALGVRLAAKLAALAAGPDEAPLKFALTAAGLYEIEDPEKLAVERRLFAWLHAANGLYVQQSGGASVVRFAAGEMREVKLGEVMGFRNRLMPDGSLDEFVRFMGERQRLYWSIDDWRAQLGAMPLVMGTRLHGNMVALSVGTPAIFLAHDTRTQELADFMAVPQADFPAVIDAGGPRALARAVRFDGDAFDANRRELARRYVRAFDRIGLVPGPVLRRLAA